MDQTINVKRDEKIQSVDGENGKEKIIWIYCDIVGKVRESIPKAGIEAYTMNCTDEKCITATFVNNSDLYVYFRSPVDGYLSIFLFDERKERGEIESKKESVYICVCGESVTKMCVYE